MEIEMVNVNMTGKEHVTATELNNSFYDRYNPQIRAVVSRILNHAGMSGEIDDCVNTVFLDIMEKLRQYNETRGSMGAFVTVIARSVALNYCKSNMRRSSELVGDEKLDFLSAPLGYHDEAEFDLLVGSIIARLNKKERVLFSMRYLYYYTPEEIAKSLNIKRSAVDMRVNRLKSKIKSFLTKGGVII
jgi:RNA polymerase sigma factor (sigma-70 family)